MGRRLELHELFVDILGTRQVYFQPPANVQMKYPCIVYELDSTDTQFADNKPYRIDRRYTATLMDTDPDGDVVEKLINLPKCVLSRTFKLENLNHFAFTIFF